MFVCVCVCFNMSHKTLRLLDMLHRYGGDRARKERLVKHGYRLPSALDNRPLRADEFWDQVDQCIFVSATPAKQERQWSPQPPVEMTIRPTFVCDPRIEVRSSLGQLDDLLREVQKRAAVQERTLAMTLTKRDAEDLSSHLLEQGVNATYLHSGLTTHERSEALKALQSGEVDCLVGVNCLREGLDLPQVSLVAILNADSEGFLRSETALLQTVGRAARNIHGQAIFYAKRETDSMKRCMQATNERRQRQLAYNQQHNCTSRSTKGSSTMSIFDLLKEEIEAEQKVEMVLSGSTTPTAGALPSLALHDPETVSSTTVRTGEVVLTDHIPSKAGVYYWKDANDKILYIGKAKQLRRRVKSYLSPGAKHSPRIRTMLEKATTVDFVITPSDRDALILESNLIKHHQPPYNVLLKDDESYPYICASIGDAFPRFFPVPRRQGGERASKYRYFGPYPHFNEINAVLEEVEQKYDLRSKSFQARHGSGTKKEYNKLFNTVLQTVFEGKGNNDDVSAMRLKFEEASLLFDSPYNKCRDVAAIAVSDDGGREAVVHVVQLRNGLVAGKFSYSCTMPEASHSHQDLAATLGTVLERQHYPSGAEATANSFSFFPDEVLLQHSLHDATELRRTIRLGRKSAEPDRSGGKVTIRSVASKGQRRETDLRAMEFAVDNAIQAVTERQLEHVAGAVKSSVDGTAIRELANMLQMEEPPRRIECYDISHTQGEVAVGSRVVFIDGTPQPNLYRKFNIRTVKGVDDYASLAEVLERRFKHVWGKESGRLVDKDDPWSMPDLVIIDGGVGQLGAAAKGMAKANIVPRALSSSMNQGGITEEEVVGNGDEVFVVPQSMDDQSSVVLCSLAKNEEQVYTYGRSNPVNDAPDSAALLLLRSLRDESHRFALRAHRQRRSKSLGM